MKKSYVIWNPSLVDSKGIKGLVYPSNTLKGLREVEAQTNEILSATVQTDEIDYLISTMDGGGNATIRYAEVPSVAE